MICDRCQGLELSEKSKERLAELASRIESLFAVQQPDLITATIDSTVSREHAGTKVISLALGGRQRFRDEDKAVAALCGKVWESFQRVFGERQTRRKFWWRERPVIMVKENFDTRGIHYGLWLRFALPDLTTVEVNDLDIVRSELTAITMEDLD